MSTDRHIYRCNACSEVLFTEEHMTGEVLVGKPDDDLMEWEHGIDFLVETLRRTEDERDDALAKLAKAEGALFQVMGVARAAFDPETDDDGSTSS